MLVNIVKIKISVATGVSLIKLSIYFKSNFIEPIKRPIGYPFLYMYLEVWFQKTKIRTIF